MRCYLIRHAQSVWNGQNRFQGRTDSPLSALGQEQARRLAEYFTGRPVGSLVTSALQRTIQTGQAIAARVGIDGRIDPDVAEMDLGGWEGLTPDEIDARYHGAYQRWRRRPSEVVIPDAEPLPAFRARVRGAFDRIVAAHDSRHDLVIVSHGGVIASLLADWLGAEYDQLLQQLVISNAGVTAVECDRSSRWVLWVNATTHLLPEVVGSPAFEPVDGKTGLVSPSKA